MLDNYVLSDSEQMDALILMRGMFATQLPPLLDAIFSKELMTELIEEIASNPKQTLFRVDEDTSLIEKLDNGIHPPKYIFGNNWAAESIKFFTLKADDSWRPMGIPNIKHALMFSYNSLIVAETSLNQLYSKKDRLEGRTSHSESPIIGRDGIFSAMLYDPLDDESDEAFGFIGYDQSDMFFKESRLHKFRIESTYPYVLQVDISKFFENIYTHLLAQIDVKEFNLSQNNTSPDATLKKYLAWLDEYNQKVNDNHTKGIIQGPISSKISAELFQLSLDQKVVSLLNRKRLDVNFTRYVDDYRFFGKTITDLEVVKNDLIKIFRDHELSFNENKVKLFKGFEVQKQAHLENYAMLDTIYSKKKIVLTFDKYRYIHDVISLILQNQDIPTLKSLLTNLKRKSEKGLVKFSNEQIVLSFLELLIKTAYVLPLVSMQTFKLINIIIKMVPTKTRHKCWNRIYSEFDYIRENFSDTDFEAWYFYVIAENGSARETAMAATQYLRSTDDLSPLILCTMLKPRSKKANQGIERAISDQVSDWATIAQTKWWLPLCKLWLSMDGNVENIEIKKLFISNHGDKIQWDKLGIIEFLRRIKKKTAKERKHIK